MLERATRLCAMSPTIAIFKPAIFPFFSLIVIMSRSAWVGCSCAPSPALIIDCLTSEASRCGAPDALWRMTIISGFIASRLRAVSMSVSPLTTELVEAEMLMVSALSLLAAISNDVLVRVLAS